MDIVKAIRELREEKRKLEVAIATLEGLSADEPVPPLNRRGRKFMPEEERRVVSERMRQYWASRRRAKG